MAQDEERDPLAERVKLMEEQIRRARAAAEAARQAAKEQAEAERRRELGEPPKAGG